MSFSVVIDASVWVSQLHSDDVNRDASRVWMKRFVTNERFVVAPSLLSIEIAAAVSRRTKDTALAKDAVKNLNDFQAKQIIPLDSELVHTAVEIATELQLRAGDAIYVALAHQMNIPLVSWDKEQISKAGKIISAYTPDSYPFPEDE